MNQVGLIILGTLNLRRIENDKRVVVVLLGGDKVCPQANPLAPPTIS